MFYHIVMPYIQQIKQFYNYGLRRTHRYLELYFVFEVKFIRDAITITSTQKGLRFKFRDAKDILITFDPVSDVDSPTHFFL